jgi:malonyl-CoA/methylmalonyl-CoA synthetase
MPNVMFDALFARHQDNHDTFLHTPDADPITYAGFMQTAGRIANAITAAGAKPGDRVLVQVQKSPAALAVYVACIQTGSIFIPLNTAYTSHEVAYFIQDAEPTVVICDSASIDAISDLTEARVLSLDEDGSGSLSDQASAQPAAYPTVARDAADIAAILYTSGTTGRSKGAMLTHENLLSNAKTLVDYWRFTQSDVLLHALPIYHTHGLFVASNTIMHCGASMIFLPKFDADSVIAQLPDATTMMGVPTFYTRLLSGDKLTGALVRHMRLFMSGSAPLLSETHEAFEQRTGQRILERYGMTETNMNTSNPYEGERKAGTVGLPLPGVDIRICDPETGSEVDHDNIGVLQVRGPNVFSGYWRMPEKTAEELLEDGFFITGDLAKRDGDGYITIVGRDKDLIISGGFNVYPKEIELVLDDLDGVLESAVVAAPHPDFGEGVVAILVTEDKRTIDLDAARQQVAEQLARFKQPKSYMIVSELPRNTMGKVQKNLLREQVRDTFVT